MQVNQTKSDARPPLAVLNCTLDKACLSYQGELIIKMVTVLHRHKQFASGCPDATLTIVACTGSL